MIIGCDLLVSNSSDLRIMMLANSVTSLFHSLLSLSSPVIVFLHASLISTTLTPI